MSKTKILLADHKEDSLDHLKSLLENHGYEVTGTRDGHHALEAITREPHQIAIIDPMISGIDGFSLSQQLRRKHPKMGIIISTGIYKGDRYQRDARTRYGASAYLEKPYADEALLRTIAELLPAKKRDTLPGIPLTNLGFDQTVEVASDDMEAELQKLKEEGVMKPEPGSSIIDGLDLDETVNDDQTISDSTASEPITPMERAKAVAAALQETVSDPNAKLDPKVAENFETLEKELAQAANEKIEPFQVADTVISKVEDFGLTSEDIFGGMITDLESGQGGAPLGGKPYDKPAPMDTTLGDQEPSFSDIGNDTNPNLAEDAGELSPSPDRTDKYELLELIGEDQAFEVWKAKIKGEAGFERIMALKRIKPYLADNNELNGLFLKEAKQAAALSHPNIVQIYELGSYDGCRFLAREFLPGQSLQSVFRLCTAKETTLPPTIVAHIGALVADALSCAHNAKSLMGVSLNIVHHHLSSDNVIISDDGEVKVMNFGTGQVTARAAGTDMVPLSQLQSLAPEQAAGSPLDHRADIFSLGSLLYMGMTGLEPFSGTDREAVMTKIREARATAVHMIRPDIPETLSAILAKAMSRNTEDRYQDASEVAQDLRDFLRKSRVRISDADVAAYLKALNSGVVPDLPSTEKAPSAEAVMEQTPHVEPAPGMEASVEPPVRRATPKSVASKESGGSKAAVFILLILILGAAGFAFWKFVLPGLQGEQDTAPITQPVPASSTPAVDEPPVEPADEVTEPAVDDTQPIEGTPVDTTQPEAEAITPPVTDTAQPQPATQPATTPAPAKPEATTDDSELKRLEEELKRKRELLKKLEEQKDNKGDQ